MVIHCPFGILFQVHLQFSQLVPERRFLHTDFELRKPEQEIREHAFLLSSIELTAGALSVRLITFVVTFVLTITALQTPRRPDDRTCA